jgi:lipoate-protein ligase A
VLHDHDITYSCVFSVGIKEMGATLMETYRIISGCLMNGLESAGIRCSAHDSPLDSHISRSSARLPCFLSPNRHEIMAGGKKLLGSAQKRSAKAVLQHGSIPLTPAFRLLPDYLALSAEERDAQKRLLVQKTTCVSEVLPDYDAVAMKRCLIDGFKSRLTFPLSEQRWSDRELVEIARITESTAFLSKWQALADREKA